MKKLLFPLTLIFLILLSSCQLFSPVQNQLKVVLSIDNSQIAVDVALGSTVQQAIAAAGISLAPLDKVDPPLSTVVTDGMQIKVTRVTEEFEVEESILPFENQTVKNETLPAGQTVLIQPGVNGKISTTYRVVKEDGVVVSKSKVKSDTLVEAKPQIMMVGVQTPYVSVPLDGKIAYITSSNAWIMQSNSGNRYPLVTSGDLDGRVFSISPDREWLLFSRSNTDSKEKSINTLWIINLEKKDSAPISLSISNVVLYADWVPGKSRTIAYSTVEPRDTAPGWQSNNDLYTITFDDNGRVIAKQTILETNAGGVYGWWGTTFCFSPDGQQIAFARPDAIGIVDQGSKTTQTLADLVPYQTRGDWAWVPGIQWSPDGQVIYTVLHGSENGTSNSESSTEFDLAAILISSKSIIRLIPNAGLFSYPVPSPMNQDKKYWVGFLSSILPDQSETSRYDLRIMDRDGSNQAKLYPGEGIQGLSPQSVVWSPLSNENGFYTLGFISQGNIMLVSTENGSISQVTGDGSVSKIDWK